MQIKIMLASMEYDHFIALMRSMRRMYGERLDKMDSEEAAAKKGEFKESESDSGRERRMRSGRFCFDISKALGAVWSIQAVGGVVGPPNNIPEIFLTRIFIARKRRMHAMQTAWQVLQVKLVTFHRKLSR